MNFRRLAKTLQAPVSYAGIGIHTGVTVSMRFVPAPPGTGVVFRRVDLPNAPCVPAFAEYVVDTSRSTTLCHQGVFVHTVEHVLAAVAAFGIDNVYIELDNIEPPVGDGSSLPFVEKLQTVACVEQEETIEPFQVVEPVYYGDDKTSLVILPSSTFQISYTLSYPGVRPIESQFYSLEIHQESFCQHIAAARTFALYQEISHLLDQGLIRGGSLQNAVVVCEDAILSKGGLRFPNEMARHKILDLVGDLSLVGFPLRGHVISIRSGHTSNVSLAKKVRALRKMQEKEKISYGTCYATKNS